MVISTNRWPLGARTSMLLAKTGFKVVALSPPGSAVRKIRAISSHYTYHSWSASRSIVRAIRDWSPAFLICSDDCAVEELHRLYVNANCGDNKTSRAVIDLIETSLGDPASFEIVRDKSKFQVFAQSLGVLCPRTAVLPADHVPEQELETGSFPTILKADRSFGGRGVRIAHDKYSAKSAFWELQFSPTHSKTLKQIYARAISTLPARWLPLPRRTVTRQEFISGRPANRAVVCLRGEVLAGISVEAVETLSDCGPATVVRMVDNPEMASAAETIVKHLNLSGFVGFDFILDPVDRAWLLELNPRLTPTSHLCEGGNNLAAALFQRLTGTVVRLPAPALNCQPITLFPQELQRCLNSAHLSHFRHDVPWEEPAFVRACLNSSLRSYSIQRMLKFLRSAPTSINGQAASILVDRRSTDDDACKCSNH